MDKSDAAVTAAPAAKTLDCTGKPLELVTAGTANGGTLYYAIGDETERPDSGWKESIPTAADSGTYYVWYRVSGDSNHNTVYCDKPVKVTIDNRFYNVSKAETSHGTVTVAESVRETELAEISFAPEEGYRLKSFSVTAADNQNVIILGESFIMPGSDVTVSAEFARVYEDGMGERLEGYTISLNGNIGVNFHMSLDGEVISDKDAYMLFNLPNGQTKKDYVSQASKKELPDVTYYVFSCEVAAKEMTDKITAQMFSGENKGKKYEYTVREYAEYLLKNKDKNAAYAKAAPLVEAMLNYGTYSQIFFDHNTEHPANEDLNIDDLSAFSAIIAQNSVYVKS